MCTQFLELVTCRSDLATRDAMHARQGISALVFIEITCHFVAFPSKFSTVLFLNNFVSTNFNMNRTRKFAHLLEISEVDDEEFDATGVSHDSTLCQINFDPENE